MNQATPVSSLSISRWSSRISLAAVFICLVFGCESRSPGYVESAPLEVWAVRSDEERPIAGVEVRALLASGKELVSRYTGPDGQARWEHVEGELVVRVEDPEGRYFSQERTVKDLKKPLLFKLSEGVSASLDIRSAGDGGARPLVAQIEVWPMDGAIVQGSTRPDGSVDLEPLPPGEVKLLISAEGHVRTVLDFTLGEAENKLGQVVLQPGGTTLKGRLRAEEPPTELSFRFRGVSIKIAAPVRGSFEFTGLTAGKGTLVGWRDGRELFRMPVDVSGPVQDLGEIDPELVAVSE